MEFGRLITAMITPFDENLQVDWEQTKRLIDYLIDEQKSDSLVVCGTTGESPTLTEEEKLGLFELAVRQAKGRCKIIAGTGSNNTMQSVQLSKKAQEIGVDGLLLVSPYYNRPSEEGLFRHFKTIAEAVSLPIMIYNVPSRTGVKISVQTTLKLAQIPNIVATKESTADLDQVTQLVQSAPEHFKVYSGDDNMTLPMMSVGGYGVVSVASHVRGKEIKEMMEAFLQGDVKRAAKLHGQLHPIFKGLFECPHRVPNPVPVKYALSLHGFDSQRVRLPLVEATEAEREFIRNLFSSTVAQKV